MLKANIIIRLPAVLLALGMLVFIEAAVCQQTATKKEKKSLKDTATSFPNSFVGHWKGKLEWIVSGKPVQQFQMQLIVKPGDSIHTFSWQIMYGDQGQDNRPYLLKAVDTIPGHWIIDEQNGILLDGYVHGKNFHGAFTVGENTIIDNYRLEGNKMFVEFFTLRLNDKTKSGKGTEDSPDVVNYRISGYQSGFLSRIK